MKAKGIWDFDVYDINDDLLQSFKVKNQITLDGSRVFCKSMTPNEAVVTPQYNANVVPAYWLQRRTWSMVFGTSVVQVSSSNIGLGVKVLEKLSSDGSSSLAQAGGEWVYTTRVDTDDGNGYTLREAGLYDNNRASFISRVLIEPVIIKSSAVWFDVTATIQYV